MKFARVASAAGFTLFAGVVLAALSRAPYEIEPGENAVVRFSWRAAERIEECRPLTDEEQAELPVHMRQTETCERRVSPFALRVQLDGQVVVHDTLSGAGARGDRPLYVYREVSVRPGRHALFVEFGAVGSDEQPLRLEQEVELAAREVVLVTRDSGGSAFAVRRRADQ
ncbi:MAG: hypothetical protein P8Y29_07380 [Gemmatimonadota bacterium]